MSDLLDFIEANTDLNDPSQVHAREWAQRMRELHKRQEELREKALALFDAGDDYASTIAEHERVSAELAQLCHRQSDVLSRLRPAPGRMQ